MKNHNRIRRKSTAQETTTQAPWWIHLDRDRKIALLHALSEKVFEIWESISSDPESFAAPSHLVSKLGRSLSPLPVSEQLEILGEVDLALKVAKTQAIGSLSDSDFSENGNVSTWRN